MKLDRLRKEFGNIGIDAMLVTSTYNVRFLTGFTGSSGAAVITADKAVFITDFRYTEQAGKQTKGYEVRQADKGLLDEIAAVAKELDIKQLGFEQDHVTFAMHGKFAGKIDSELVPVSGVIEKLRMVKTPDEIQVIRQAAKIADDAFEHIIKFIEPGKTELEVSNELEFFMRKQGATSSSFDIIVASGIRSALPHGVASGKVIEKGDFVTLDFGALYNGYVSDITRTVSVGEPSAKLKEIYEIVLEAQVAALEQIKPGMTGKEADAVSRDFIKAKGYGDAFGHSLGHGIGLEVHEGPTLSYAAETELEENMAVTVEPGIYLAGIGGVRIEDDIIITGTGNERLTHSTKELLIL
ncbi:M24 family metallopeptidase [Indiicoccus explosivorum]|uniref:M24 family metallopeptidase n=1 Tax=Indiicoccus explosivorum TaxID=1917864 RepID=UPI000B43E6C2|nr:Xaa-Pro peptidase family protein [Indiicoccus explosivorum]